MTRMIIVGVVATAVAPLAACGSDDTSSPPASSPTVDGTGRIASYSAPPRPIVPAAQQTALVRKLRDAGASGQAPDAKLIHYAEGLCGDVMRDVDDAGLVRNAVIRFTYASDVPNIAQARRFVAIVRAADFCR